MASLDKDSCSLTAEKACAANHKHFHFLSHLQGNV
jgi:hypothetical protein